MFVNILKSIAWVALYFIASFIGAIGALVGHLLIFGFEIPNTDNADILADSIVELVLKTAVPGLIIAAIICIIAFLVYKKLNKEPLDIKKVEGDRAFFCVGLGLLLNAVITLVLGLLTSIIPPSANEALDSSLNIALTGNFFVLLIGTGILVPIMEEIIFRFGVHKTIAQSNVVVAYIVSSLFFGIMHGNIIQGIYAAVLGFVFALILTKTDNIWYPIIIHMSINSSSTIITQFLDTTPEWIFMVAMAGGGLAIVVPMLFKKNIREMFTGKPVAVIAEGEDTNVF